MHHDDNIVGVSDLDRINLPSDPYWKSLFFSGLIIGRECDDTVDDIDDRNNEDDGYSPSNVTIGGGRHRRVTTYNNNNNDHDCIIEKLLCDPYSTESLILKETPDLINDLSMIVGFVYLLKPTIHPQAPFIQLLQ